MNELIPESAGRPRQTQRRTELIAPKRLHYLDGDDFIPLPEWARFFLQLGSWIASALKTHQRLVCVASIPTRSHAAVFAAAGAVGQRIELPIAQSTSEYIQRLRELPIGSSVFYHVEAAKKVPCKLRGCVEEDGTEYVLLEAGGGLFWYIPMARILRIELSRRSLPTLPANPTARTVRANVPFLRLILEREQLESLLRYSRLEVMVIGNEGLLRGEILSPTLALFDRKGAVITGKLHDLLRVRRFLTADAPFRSDILPARTSIFSGGEQPWIAIFDGSTSFLRWFDKWPASGWLVVLDRTDSHFEEAINEANRQHAMSAAKEPRISDLPASPPGVEYVIYQRDSA